MLQLSVAYMEELSNMVSRATLAHRIWQRMALQPQMVSQAPSALELLNDLVYMFNFVMRRVLVCVVNSHVCLKQHVCAKKYCHGMNIRKMKCTNIFTNVSSDT